MSKSHPPTPEICPVCGEDVPPNALACPECGADHQSGWREEADSVSAIGHEEEEEFDYEAFVNREFDRSPKPSGIRPVWWITAIVLLLAFGAFYVLALR